MGESGTVSANSARRSNDNDRSRKQPVHAARRQRDPRSSNADAETFAVRNKTGGKHAVDTGDNRHARKYGETDDVSKNNAREKAGEDAFAKR